MIPASLITTNTLDQLVKPFFGGDTINSLTGDAAVVADILFERTGGPSPLLAARLHTGDTPTVVAHSQLQLWMNHACDGNQIHEGLLHAHPRSSGHVVVYNVLPVLGENSTLIHGRRAVEARPNGTIYQGRCRLLWVFSLYGILPPYDRSVRGL